MLSTTLLLSGCGGNVESVDAGQEPTLQPLLYAGSDGTRPARADTDSFTLQPAKEFKGFNPEIWNDRKAWYECDCGRHPQKQSKKMDWNPV